MNIVLNIPHSSFDNPTQYGWGCDIFPHMLEWTDWYTDELFQDERCKSVIYNHSRFICDVERLLDDPLEKMGQGIIYKRFENATRLVDETMERNLMDSYFKHIEKIRSLLTKDSLLIDCHSFPSKLSNIDICIGYNNDWSKPSNELIGIVASAFREHGYTVGINTPYSNSLSPNTGFIYKSIMIEINKRNYMLEDKIIKSNGFDKLYKITREIYGKILC